RIMDDEVFEDARGRQQDNSRLGASERTEKHTSATSKPRSYTLCSLSETEETSDSVGTTKATGEDETADSLKTCRPPQTVSEDEAGATGTSASDKKEHEDDSTEKTSPSGADSADTPALPLPSVLLVTSQRKRKEGIGNGKRASTAETSPVDEELQKKLQERLKRAGDADSTEGE
ncbi:hypothetical protein BaRGS_00000721, partial [Batillaria attramentaria]